MLDWVLRVFLCQYQIWLLLFGVSREIVCLLKLSFIIVGFRNENVSFNEIEVY